MAISSLVVRSGIGSWSDIAHLITRGLNIGVVTSPWTEVSPPSTVWSTVSGPTNTWTDVPPPSTTWTPS